MKKMEVYKGEWVLERKLYVYDFTVVGLEF